MHRLGSGMKWNGTCLPILLKKQTYILVLTFSWQQINHRLESYYFSRGVYFTFTSIVQGGPLRQIKKTDQCPLSDQCPISILLDGSSTFWASRTWYRGTKSCLGVVRHTKCVNTTQRCEHHTKLMYILWKSDCIDHYYIRIICKFQNVSSKFQLGHLLLGQISSEHFQSEV